MKVLIWYCKKLEIGKCKLNDSSVSIKVLNSTKKIKERKVLNPWITIEGKEDENYFEDFEKDIKEMSDYFKTDKIVILPFVHFVYDIPPYSLSFEVLMKLKAFLESKKYKVQLAHFGFAKDLKFFSPADEKQVLMRSYPSKTLANIEKKREEQKEVKKESVWFNNKIKAMKKGKTTKPKTKKSIKAKSKKVNMKKTKKTLASTKKILTPIRAEKKPEKKEWKSSLYNLAPSARGKK